jgi:excisionase family DNA binding protein
MFLTLGEAAKQSGFSKSTISRAIHDGKLSAQKSVETNSFKIDPAELHRYTEAMQVVRNTVETEPEKRVATPLKDNGTGSETSFETLLKEAKERAELEARARLAEERLSDLKQQVEDIKRQRDKWQEQAERLAIAPPVQTPVLTPTPAPVQTAAPWWPWKRTA